MKTLKLEDAPLFPGAGDLNAKSLFDSTELGIVHFTLKPGGYIPLHNMPFEVCFLILEGRGTLIVNDSNYEVESDTAIRCLPELRRGWRNFSTDAPLKVLVMKIKEDMENLGEKLSISRLAELKKQANPHGADVRRIYDSSHALISCITLEPGENLLRHITPVNAFFFTLQGRGTVEIGEETVNVSDATLVESPADIPHCWFNEDTDTLRFLVIKSPKPTTPTKFL